MRRAWIALVAASIAMSRAASAEDEFPVDLDPPSPPTLPSLLHPGLDLSFQYTGAGIELNEATGVDGPPPTSPYAFAYMLHAEVEVPLIPRKWYAGWANDAASGAVPGSGRALLVGNPEVWSRGVWWNLSGLSSGAGLGVVLPLPRDLDAQEDEVLRTVRVVRPWDSAYFLDLTLTARPFFDIRHVTGRFLFQFRQGVDWSYDFNAADQDLTARATLYVGYRAAKPLGLGIELWEVYQLTADVPDDHRAAFTVSPSVRFMLGRVRPAVSALLPIATPLRGDVASYVAGRISVAFSFDIYGEDGGLPD
jgi:hypothetical protein